MCWKGSNTSFVKQILVAVYGVWVEEKVRREKRDVMCKKNGWEEKILQLNMYRYYVIQ